MLQFERIGTPYIKSDFPDCMDIPQDVELAFQYMEAYQDPGEVTFRSMEPKVLKDAFFIPNSYHDFVIDRLGGPTVKTERNVYDSNELEQKLKTQLWEHFDKVMDYTFNELGQIRHLIKDPKPNYQKQNVVVSFNDGERQMTFGRGNDNFFKVPFNLSIYRKGDLVDGCAVFARNPEGEIDLIKELSYDELSNFAVEPCQ